MGLIEQNTVAAAEQVSEKERVQIKQGAGALKVLFVGNSITLHGPKPDIGWNGNWGMAASGIDKDYVHVTVDLLRARLGEVDYCLVNCADWERCYWDETILEQWRAAREFEADVVVIRLGENSWSVRDKLTEIDYAPHFARMIRFFASNPKAKVIVTDLFWSKEALDAPIRSVALENGYALVGLNDLGEADENMAIGEYEHRGVSLHPNDTGMRRIAERITEKIIM